MNNDRLLFGVLSLLAGIVYYVKAQYERKKSVRIDGIISSFEQNGGNYFPVVTFCYEDDEYTMRAANGGSRMNGEVGDAVEVFYRPSNQKYVHLVGSNGDITVAIVLIVLGGILTAVAFLS